MRDLGLMGESQFELWCADAGLIPNKSQVDKTGWDFIVEFPFSKEVSTVDVHKSAFECKVQVKATDKRDRKLPITLSNLRRLVTAQIPAFFVFIEFDGQSTPQHAFVVHVDSSLVTNVLKRLYILEQGEQESNFNKRTMTVYYTETDELEVLDGQCLKSCLLRHVGNDLSEYITKKKIHLESTGFEKGKGRIGFSTKDTDNLKKLINVSLGIEEKVEVHDFVMAQYRFGINCSKSISEPEKALLSMPDLTPAAKGKISFKERKLSTGLSFNVELYISPFNPFVEKELVKCRLRGEFFDLLFYPFSGRAYLSFSFESVRLEVSQFRDALKLIKILTEPNKTVFVEVSLSEFPYFSYIMTGSECASDFSEPEKILSCIFGIIDFFDFRDVIRISLDELLIHQHRIKIMYACLTEDLNSFGADIQIFESNFSNKKVALISPVTALIGDYVFYVFIVIVGELVWSIADSYKLLPKNVYREFEFVVDRGKKINNSDFEDLFSTISSKYENDFFVIVNRQR